MGSRWDDVLDDWQAWLDRLAGTLDGGDWESLADEPAWEQPPDLEQPPDAAQQARLRELTLRAAALRERLDHAAREVTEGLADQRKVRGAHDAYRAQGRPPRRR